MSQTRTKNNALRNYLFKSLCLVLLFSLTLSAALPPARALAEGETPAPTEAPVAETPVVEATGTQAGDAQDSPIAAPTDTPLVVDVVVTDTATLEPAPTETPLEVEAPTLAPSATEEPTLAAPVSEPPGEPDATLEAPRRFYHTDWRGFPPTAQDGAQGNGSRIESSPPTLLQQWGATNMDDAGKYKEPWDVALDGAGNLYILDTSNNKVKKYNSSLTHLLTFGSLDWENGKFCFPTGIAVSSAGTIYVADTCNNRIQKFNSNGNWLKSWGSWGSGNGEFKNPVGIALDGAENVYVVEESNHRVQKFTSNGDYVTQFGSWGTGNYQFRYPHAIAVDGNGSVFVTDDSEYTKKFSSSNGVTYNYVTRIGGPGGEAGTSWGLYGVEVDGAGNVYITDEEHRVQKFRKVNETTYTYQTQFGSPGLGDGQLNKPRGLAVNAAGTQVFVADTYNHKIKFFASGDGNSYAYQAGWGSELRPNGFLNFPNGIAVNSSSGRVYVADLYNHRVQVFSAAGGYITKWGNMVNSGGAYDYIYAVDVALDSSGYVYVLDRWHNRVMKYTPDGTPLQQFGGWWGSGDGEMAHPSSLAIGPDGSVYVYEADNHRVSKFAANGGFLLKWGSEGTGNGQFGWSESGITVDNSGNVYVCDEENSRVQKFTANGVFLAAYGSYGAGIKQLEGPGDIVVDSSGRMYITSRWDSRVVVLDSSGAFLTQWGAWGSGNGQLHNPRGIALDASNRVYVVDSGNMRVLRFTTPWGTPPAPLLGAPSGTINTRLPTYTWNTASNAATYSLQIDSLGWMQLRAEGICEDTTCTVQPYTPLADGAHTWQVYATNSSGVQGATASGSFTVAFTPPTGVAAVWGWTDQYSPGKFGDVVDVAVDNSGNIYVADAKFFRVLKYSSTGTLLSQWGGTRSGDNSKFDWPYGVGVDGSGNVYVADGGNGRVQKFDSQGNLLTRIGEWGSGDGQFQFPIDTAVDSAGNLYVVDTDNNRIQKFTPNGTGYDYAAQWGSYGTAAGQFDSPRSIAIDTANRIYVTESNNNRVQVFNSSGVFQRQWGSYGTGNGQFRFPAGIAVDGSNNVYVADQDNHRVQKFTSIGGFLAAYGGVGFGNGNLNNPTGVALDSSNNIIIGDLGNYNIQVFDSGGNFVRKWGADLSANDALTYVNRPLVNNAGDALFVADIMHHTIKRFSLNGTYQSQFGTPGSGNGQLNFPINIATDSAGNFYVADSGNYRVQKFDSSGTYVSQFGSKGSGNGQFKDYIRGIVVDAAGSVFVADTGNHRIQKFTTADGTTYTYASQFGSEGAGNGQFRSPWGIALDSSGRIYVADRGNDRIQKFNAAGTYLAQWGTSGDGDAQFNNPSDVFLDDNDNVYVADSYHDCIKVFRPGGSFVTRLGSYGMSEGKFHAPRGVSVDKDGFVYVGDHLYNRIQKLNPFLYTISGQVLGSDNAPLAGAQVSIGARSLTTPADGMFTLKVVPAGSYTLTVSKSGYSFPSAAINITTASVTGQVLSASPTAPTPLSPNATVRSTAPQFKWTPNPIATRYMLYVYTTANVRAFSGEVTPTCDATTCTYTPTFTLAVGAYKWAVKAGDVNKYGSNSTWTNFSVDLPLPPTPQTPTGAINTPNPAFTWTKSGGATGYALYVYTSANAKVFAGAVVPTCVGTTCTYNSSLGLGAGNYKWAVKAGNANGMSATSAWLNFSAEIPPAPTPLSPNATVRSTAPQFKWTKPAAATLYKLYVYTSANGKIYSGDVTPTCDATQCTYTPSFTLGLGNYKWAVKAGNVFGWSANSAWTNFNVALPLPPTPQTPTGTISTGNPVFTWTKSSGATGYSLYVYTAGNVKMYAGAVVPTCVGTTCTYNSSLGLSAGNYKWALKAGNANGMSATSAWLNFSVQ